MALVGASSVVVVMKAAGGGGSSSALFFLRHYATVISRSRCCCSSSISDYWCQPNLRLSIRPRPNNNLNHNRRDLFPSTAAAARSVSCMATPDENSAAASALTTSSDNNSPIRQTSSSSVGGGDNGDDAAVMNLKNAANSLEIRVGRIVRAWKHEEADSLYVEEVDIGDPQQPRLICSGLVNYIPVHLLQDKKVVVLANLKARNMRGIKSFGMLIAASDPSHENVELLEPPEGSLPGERVWFGNDGDEIENLPDPATPNQVQKKKIWEFVQPHLRTDSSCVAVLGDVGDVMRTSAGVVRCRSLKGANVS